jgi:hypothetical protein
MTVGSAEDVQRIMSTSTRFRLKRRPNIIKDAVQSFSSSVVSNKEHDAGVLQSLGFVNIALQEQLRPNSSSRLQDQLLMLHIDPNLYISCSSESLCSITLNIAMNTSMENSFQIEKCVLNSCSLQYDVETTSGFFIPHGLGNMQQMVH